MVLLLGPTGILAVNIGGTPIHSCYGLKPVTTLLGLNYKSKAALRNRLSEVLLLIIDEFSMVWSDLWADIDSRMEETFMMIPEIAFVGIPVMTVADFLEVPPVRGKLIFFKFFDKDSMKVGCIFLDLQLWHLFRYAEFTEVVRQTDKLFID